MSSRDLVRDAGPNADILWLRLGHVFNTVNFESDKFEPNEAFTQNMRRCRPSLSKKPLSEDFQTRGIKFFEDRQKSIDWKDQDFLTADDLVRIFQKDIFLNDKSLGKM